MHVELDRTENLQEQFAGALLEAANPLAHERECLSFPTVDLNNSVANFE
jgi:hypothetical protein